MKKIIVITFLTIISFSVPGMAGAEQTQNTNNDSYNNQIYKPSWWQSLSQTWSYDQSNLKGNGESGTYQGTASGLHIKPAWHWQRFEGKFDFALYTNPWENDEWQWGKPVPAIKPVLPNFIDSLIYNRKSIIIKYQDINSLNFGYGLILNEYHSADPYHGWRIDLNPTTTTAVLLIATQEIIYFEPFLSNELASFQAIRLEQSVQTGKLKWKLGLTGVHDGYKYPEPVRHPSSGSEYDLSLTNIIWCSPFLESGSYKDFGKADMFGVKGKLGLISYQVGQFKTRGLFWPNFFGGGYEELKFNSVSDKNEPGLPDLSLLDEDNRNGYIGRLWVEVNPWLAAGYLYIDDLEDTNGFNFTVKIERLKTESGLFYYRMFDKDTYDWFIKGEAGFFDYAFHFCQDWDHKYRNEFEISYRF